MTKEEFMAIAIPACEGIKHTENIPENCWNLAQYSHNPERLKRLFIEAFKKKLDK